MPYARKPRKLRAFSASGGSLQTPESGNFGENLAKVSGQFPGYSRFRETFRGDRFRTALSGKGGSAIKPKFERERVIVYLARFRTKRRT